MYVDGDNEFMKVLLIEVPPLDATKQTHSSFRGILTVGNWYTAHLVPTITDPLTLGTAEPKYVVLCDDESWRKVDTKHFITQAEHRDNKLKQILK